jgi:hypothetical protein
MRLGILILVLAVPSPLFSQEKTLSARLLPLVARSRTGAPIIVEVTLDWQGTSIIQGQLELSLTDGNRILSRFRTDTLALTTGQQTYQLFLPPLQTEVYSEQIEAQMTFLTDTGALNLGKALLFMPVRVARSFVICVSSPGRSVSKSLFNTVRSMALEQFNPNQTEGELRSIATFNAFVLPEEFPLYPLAYCCYDIVFLTEDGFASLKERQLVALKTWVFSGGSVCITAGRGLRTHHLHFLNELTASDRTKPGFALTEEGRVTATGIIMHYAGLGRAVIVAATLDDEFLKSTQWREAVGFLWKIRASQMRSVLARGKWQGFQTDDTSYGSYQHQTFHFQRDSIGGEIVQKVLPESISLVPLWLIIIILSIFVLVIGPVDYFLLGFFKVRRFTWVFFPVVSVGFTLFVVYLSEKYVGSAGCRGSIVFVDVGQGGRILRQNRYEVFFPSKEREVITEGKNALIIPLSKAGYWESKYYGGYQPDDSERGALLHWYEGKMPGAYKLTQRIYQWTAQLNRKFSLDAVEPQIDLNWDDLKSPDCCDAPDIRERIFGSKSSEDSVFVLSNVRDDFKLRWVAGKEILSHDLMMAACMRGNEGLFSAVSQISPVGGDTFEDLCLLDSTDPGQWLLIVVVRRGDDILIYRRLYHGEE